MNAIHATKPELVDGMELILYGADGSVWPLIGEENEGKPYRWMEGDVSQLYMTPFESTYREQVGGGSAYRGHRQVAAFFTLRIDVIGADWARTHALLARALRPDADAVLEARTATGGARRLVIRAYEQMRVNNVHDPHVGKAIILEAPLIAPMPAWTAVNPATDEWTASAEQITGELVVTNPGDLPAWPEYVLTAPAGWILPDVDFDEPLDRARVIEIPWLPFGRDSVVHTDPRKLTIESVDESLAPLAGLRGAHFINPIPPGAIDAALPVAIDPLPALELAIPAEWKRWIAIKLAQAAEAMGIDAWLAQTPTQVGNRVRSIITGARPTWLPDLSDGLIAELTAKAIADLWAAQYGRWGVIAGSTVQVRIYPRWWSPW